VKGDWKGDLLEDDFFFVFNPLFEGRLQSPLLLVIGKRGLHLVNLVEMLLQS
jgi:hypothetical protein